MNDFMIRSARISTLGSCIDSAIKGMYSSFLIKVLSIKTLDFLLLHNTFTYQYLIVLYMRII